MEIAVIKLIEVPNGAICKRPDIGSGKPVVDSGYCTYCVRTLWTKPKFEEFARCKLFDMNLELDKGVPLKCSDCLASCVADPANITQNLRIVRL